MPTSSDWPDWTGRAVAIIASGPSAKKAGVERLEGRLPVLAIKQNVDLAPFAEAVYGCDYPWWRSVEGLPKFRGLKLAYEPRACDQYGCQRVEIPNKLGDKLLFEKTGVVAAGGNSGFQALNLAAQFGATKILLVGIDLHGRCGAHWYGRNVAPGMSNPSDDNYRRWLRAFEAAAPDLAARGIEVVNTSPLSDLKAYPQRTIDQALQDWGLA